MTPDYGIAPLDGHGRITPQDVVDWWVAEGALDLEKATRRVDEVLLVATADGRIAGVGTAYVAQEPQLRMDLWFYRTFVGAADRRSAVALLLAYEAQRELEARWTSGDDRRGAGVAFVVQSDILRGRFPDAVWPRMQTSFVTRRGTSDLRVRYFPGALAPDPPR